MLPKADFFTERILKYPREKDHPVGVCKKAIQTHKKYEWQINT